jgi:hypothetical protein
MTDGKEELRRGKPATAIKDQSKPQRVDDQAEGEEMSTGTHGGEHKTGNKGLPPTGKGNIGRRHE